MRVCFDTEFTDFSEDAKLISIGLVSEHGDSFYAELTDTYALEDCSDFVLESVLPHLEGGAAQMTFKELQTCLYQWLHDLGNQVTLMTDSIPWDGYWLRQIFDGKHNTLPANVEKSITDLTWMIDSPHSDESAVHHALLDAKVLHDRLRGS